MKKYTYLLLLLFVTINLSAQVGINTDNSDPDASAMLDVKSTNKGVLIPRMSSTQRQQIIEPVVGLMVYDSTAQAFYYFNGMGWLELLSGSVTVLEDTDGDTKIQIEESADEDVIRFDIAGSEVMKIDGTGIELISPSKSTIIGEGAGDSPLSNDYNAFYGYEAGKNNATSHENTILGAFAGKNINSSSQSTLIGAYAGQNMISAFSNVYIGTLAGSGNQHGNQNTFIGMDAGSGNSGSGNVFLGTTAGRGTGNVSNRLIIDNDYFDGPFLYGEFDNKLLRINGTLNINNAFSFPTIDGTANQILQTDGAGTVTWATHSDNVNDADADPTNELQQLSLSENTLSISNGNAVNLSSLVDDKDWVISSETNITNNNEGNVGIGDMAPTQNRWQLTVKDTVNSMLGADSIDVSELFAVFARNINENNIGVGIGFQSTSTVTGMGAAIVHERTNSNSRGKLHFATKASGSAADEDLPIRMTIDEMGNVGIGITSPRQKLDVIGDGIIDGNLEVTGTFPGSDDQTIDVLNLNGNNLEISLENDNQATQTVDLSNLAVPIGSIMMWATATPPTGWMLCNGQDITGTPLATVLGSNNAPNLQNRFPFGAGSLFSLEETGGRQAITLTEANIPEHNHDAGTLKTTYNYKSNNSNAGSSSNKDGSDVQFYDGNAITGNTGNWGGFNGSTKSFEILPPFLALNFIIKAE